MTRQKISKVTKKEKKQAVSHNQLELNMILARLALPEEKRTGFLRRRLPNGGSFL